MVDDVKDGTSDEHLDKTDGNGSNTDTEGALRAQTADSSVASSSVRGCTTVVS